MTVTGMRSASITSRTAARAVASVTSAATEKLMVAAENWSTCRSRSCTMPKCQRATSASATDLPSLVMICTRSSASGFSVKRSETSITTRYWLRSWYSVATWRCANELLSAAEISVSCTPSRLAVLRSMSSTIWRVSSPRL